MPPGGMARYRALEWLIFIATELDKGLSPLWDPNTPAATRRAMLHKLATRFSHIEARTAGGNYLMGREFGAPDAYAFTILNWAGPLNVDLSPWPGLQAYVARVAARPGVRAALAAEGLLKDELAA
jgi:glutathione S-transferase